jgi:hypothetical protein
MKAKIIDGVISIGPVPSNYKNYVGFDKMSDELHTSEGFYPVVSPHYNPEYQELGELYFDEENEVFTYKVKLQTLNIEEIREAKKAEFKEIVEKKVMNALLVGGLEKLIMGEKIPQELKDKIIALRAREQEVYNAIDSIESPLAMKRFSFDEKEINDHIDGLKKIRYKKND